MDIREKIAFFFSMRSHASRTMQKVESCLMFWQDFVILPIISDVRVLQISDVTALADKYKGFCFKLPFVSAYFCLMVSFYENHISKDTLFLYV